MVVGGLTTLSAMEKVPVDDDDRPLSQTRKKKRQRRRRKRMRIMIRLDHGIATQELVLLVQQVLVVGLANGKYLKARTAGSVDVTGSAGAADGSSKKRKATASSVEFKDFSGW